MSLLECVRRYDPSILSLNLTNHGRLDNAVAKLERQADGLEKYEMEPGRDEIIEVVKSIRHGTPPPRRLAKLVAMGALPEIQKRKDGDELITKFLDMVVQSTSGVLVRCVLIGYLRIADSEGALAETLRKFCARHKDRLQRQWQIRVEQFGLLDKDPGDTLARSIMDTPNETPVEVMHRAGLRGIMESSGFVRLAFKKITLQLAKGHTIDQLDRFWQWVRLPDQATIRFSSDIESYALALLSPYLRKEPSGDVKSTIKSFLIKHFYDPRLRAPEWRFVRHELQSVLMRWLTEESFELLLSIVSKSNDTRQWQERQEFWQRYLNAGLITEAWVALGSRAEQTARAMVRSGELETSGGYGVLLKDSIDPYHSMILMRIGDWVISEWTHSGKLRFYHEPRNHHTPKLYQRTYQPHQIRHDDWANENFIHHTNWTSNATYFLSNNVGVRLAERSGQSVQCISCRNFVAKSRLDDNGKCSRCNRPGIRIR